MRPRSIDKKPPCKKFQSTHPRGVRPQRNCCDISPSRVSIHAPAWGATFTGKQIGLILISFNPRTRVGCDDEKLLKMSHMERFQSTHPRGVRQSNRFDFWQKEYVSIHAPAWGATMSLLLTACNTSSFNPRTRVGCDTLSFVQDDPFWPFQSTHPRGVRRSLIRKGVYSHNVSIHAPAWGATVWL